MNNADSRLQKHVKYLLNVLKWWCDLFDLTDSCKSCLHDIPMSTYCKLFILKNETLISAMNLLKIISMVWVCLFNIQLVFKTQHTALGYQYPKVRCKLVGRLQNRNGNEVSEYQSVKEIRPTLGWFLRSFELVEWVCWLVWEERRERHAIKLPGNNVSGYHFN